MNHAAHNKLISFIWSIADDCLRDVYVRGKYRDVILPMVVLRRLDTLLERMPAGLEQMVGESGWRLSHGERSRIYIARSLLQKADLLILDESFGALDGTSLRTVLACVERRAPALLVIAHQ